MRDLFDVKTFSVCRKALKPGNKLFIVDSIVDRNLPDYRLTATVDALRLTVYDSKERTKEQFEALLVQNGFRIEKANNCVFEGVIEAVTI